MNESWHAKTTPATLAALETSERGLSATLAAERLREHGPNELPKAKADSLFILFIRQFESPLIYLLFAAAGAVYLVGETVDAVIIFAVLFVNAVVGTIQEGRAQNTLRALERFSETRATVVRDGTEIIIPDREVVPGDIIVLNEGEKIPADARVLDAHTLKVNEASLTGESEPVGKTTEPMRLEAPIAERRNMVFKGTSVVAGNGRAIVVATGLSTAIGGIARAITTITTEIPLQGNIRALSRAIIIVVALIGGSILALGLVEGRALSDVLATVVSLSVSIIPEGLPVVITLVLATGVWRMSKRNALVKRLQAVEALGQARVIAVDKTGTLTKNELVVCEVYAEGVTYRVGGVGYEPTGEIELNGAAIAPANHEPLLFAGKAAALLAHARVSYFEDEKLWRVAGDPTEAALLVFGEKVGFRKEELLRETPLLSEVPFDYRLKYHATTHRTSHGALTTVIGAPEAVMALTTRVRAGEKLHPLGNEERLRLMAVADEMSGRGLRILAYAVREDEHPAKDGEPIEHLVFGGFFGLQDALRPNVAETVARAEDAGIKVVMITGDHQRTARAIAEKAGIFKEGDTILTGADMDALSDLELASRLEDATVFARVTPEHKLRIIRAYQHRGEIVAMTGDGVNDAPSLVAADLGVSMGVIGTEVAKEASDIVLLDDNFGNIISAVEEGRNIYVTIKKVVLYLFSTSLGEVLTIVGALALNFPLPLLAVQILWLNFVTDGFLDVALAMEPEEQNLLSRRFERPKKYLVDRLMAVRMVTMALPMMVGTLILFSNNLGGDPVKAWTMSLTVLAVFQWFNAWNCRSGTESVFQMNPFSNTYLVGATFVIIALQLLALYAAPFQAILHTVPLSLSEWGIIILTALPILLIEELRKLLVRITHRFSAET